MKNRQSITLGASLASVIVVVGLLVRRHCRGVIGHKLGNRQDRVRLHS
jgi:hypothetical protein